MPAFERFLRQVQKDLKLWLAAMVFFGAFRAVFILAFRSQLDGQPSWSDFFVAFARGARFDSRAATVWVAPAVLASVAAALFDRERLAERVRFVAGIVFLVVSLAVCRAAVGFYDEYADNFNHWVLEIFYDDPGAVAGTVAKEYDIAFEVLAWASASALGALALRAWLRREFVPPARLRRIFARRAARVAFSALAGLLFVAGLRGSVGRRPAQEKDAAVSQVQVLNKAVVNPYLALHFAFKTYWRISGANALQTYLPGGDIRAALALATGRGENLPDLDAYLERRAAGTPGNRPEHVFLIIMESYSAWPLLEEYRPLGIAREMERLGRGGILLLNFLPCSEGTMGSVCSLLTTLPDAGVHMHYREAARKPLPSSLAVIFQRLGYRTRFFYSGYLSWQRLGDFCREQGFDEVYGGAHVAPRQLADEWGAADQFLFDFAAERIPPDVPSFNAILTTSCHPPFSVNVEAEGFPLREFPPGLAPQPGAGANYRVLGHFWYSDRCLGRFVDRMCEAAPRSVFAVTGDHYGRRHILTRPRFYDRTAVPLLLYGPEVLPKGLHLETAGSHIDVGPTLVELCAPEGFAYHTLGRSLLAPDRRPLGFGRRAVIGLEFLIETEGPDRKPGLHALPWASAPKLAEAEIASLARLQRAILAVSWWRAMRGAELPHE
ncbi:MAG: LTA synthase family protein [Planctomycetota bacterium]